MAGNNEFKYSSKDAINWANYIIKNNATLAETSAHFDNIPITTIWRYIKNETPDSILKKVLEILEKHKKDSPHKAISKKWENYYTNQSS